MKLAIVGSMESAWDDFALPRVAIATVCEIYEPDILISGESPKGGVDIWTKEYAIYNDIPFIGFPPETFDWAGYRNRNLQIAQACDTLVAIRSYRSASYGSGWTADRAREFGKKVKVITI